jgi:hypothetical protein
MTTITSVSNAATRLLQIDDNIYTGVNNRGVVIARLMNAEDDGQVTTIVSHENYVVAVLCPDGLCSECSHQIINIFIINLFSPLLLGRRDNSTG